MSNIDSEKEALKQEVESLRKERNHLSEELRKCKIREVKLKYAAPSDSTHSGKMFQTEAPQTEMPEASVKTEVAAEEKTETTSETVEQTSQPEPSSTETSDTEET